MYIYIYILYIYTYIYIIHMYVYVFTHMYKSGHKCSTTYRVLKSHKCKMDIIYM